MAALQSKVLLLGVLFVVFTLVAVPLFHQVRADVNQEKASFKNTHLMKFLRSVNKDFQPPKDIEVEDADYQRWREQNPQCGEQCDPNADYDKDGMSNQEELDKGRNPACDESHFGDDYCQGKSKEQPIPDPNDPGNVSQPPITDLIADWKDGRPGGEYAFVSPLEQRGSNSTPDPYYDRWQLSVRLTGYRGVFSYNVEIYDEQDVVKYSVGRSVSIGETTDSFDDTLDANERDLMNGNYTLRLSSNDPPGTVQGTWDVTIRATRDGNG